MSVPAPVRLVSVKLTHVGRAHSYVMDPRQAQAGGPLPGDKVVVQSEAGAAVGTVVRSVPPLAEKRSIGADSPQRVVRMASR